jgi:hypothetical protein
MSEILDAYKCSIKNGFLEDNDIKAIAAVNKSINDIVLTANLIESSLVNELCCSADYMSQSLEYCGCADT